MHEFIHWVEFRGSVYYLIDSEITTTSTFTGKPVLRAEFLKYGNTNDILGPDAIIKHFKLDKELSMVYRASRFWDPRCLPSGIAQKVLYFDSYWGFMFQNGFFKVPQLLFVLEDISESETLWRDWRGKAWNQALRQGVTAQDLILFLEHNFIKAYNKRITDVWKEIVAKKLLDLIEKQIKDLEDFYLWGYLDKKRKVPRVDAWGLHVIRMIFPGDHKLWADAEKARNHFLTGVLSKKKKTK